MNELDERLRVLVNIDANHRRREDTWKSSRRERDRRRHWSRKKAKPVFNRYYPEGSIEDRLTNEFLADAGEMRFRTKVPMDDQAKEFHFLSFHQQLMDGGLPNTDLTRYDELATEMGFLWMAKDRPFPYQTWLPQTGGDADYQRVVWQIMVLAERIYLEQIVKFKEGVFLGGRRPRVIVNDGRSTEIFVTVCIYIAARQFQRLFELFPDEMAEHYSLEGKSMPATVSDKTVWIKSLRISTNPFNKYIELLTGNNNHELRHPIPVKYILLARYSKKYAELIEVEVGPEGGRMLRIPQAVLDAYAIPEDEFIDPGIRVERRG